MSDKECPNCQGEGIIDFPEGHPITEEESMAHCTACNGTGSVLIDYEPCGECGFDHGYEPYEAARVHTVIDPEPSMDASQIAD